MPVLTKHLFTTEEYYRMAETGVIKPDARVELLDGEIIDMFPTGPLHGGSTKYLNNLFSVRARGRWILAVQDPVSLDKHCQPQPDLMLLKCAKDFYRKRHPGPADVFLLVEVAETSLDYDREKKLPAYGRAGITEVWIVNLQDRVLEVYRDPHLTGYSSITLLRSGDTARPTAFPDVAVQLADLFGK
jgi:Uma2 family endonuclease